MIKLRNISACQRSTINDELDGLAQGSPLGGIFTKLTRARKIVTVTFLIAVFACDALAQPDCINGPSNVRTARDLPLWSGGRNASSASPGNEYLFYDRQRDEVVVYFPETLNDPGADSEKWIEFRWEPQFLVAPVVKAEFMRSEDNWYEYKYAVANGSSAKRQIKFFTLVVPINADDLILSHPTWFSFASKQIPPSGRPQAAIVDSKGLRDSANLGRSAGWMPKDYSQGINPASGIDGFGVRSRFLPGIITAFAHSGSALRVNVEIPPKIHDQMVTLLAPERNYRSLATIGPKFPADAQPALVARDFQNVLDFLTKQGCLATDSPLIKEIKGILDKSASANARFPIVFRAKPSTEFEAQIAQALVASLEFPAQ